MCDFVSCIAPGVECAWERMLESCSSFCLFPPENLAAMRRFGNGFLAFRGGAAAWELVARLSESWPPKGSLPCVRVLSSPVVSVRSGLLTFGRGGAPSGARHAGGGRRGALLHAAAVKSLELGGDER